MDEEEFDSKISELAEKNLSISDAIIELIKIYDQNPYEINCGNCEDFGQHLMTIFPEANGFWDDELNDRVLDGDIGSHYFVLYQGKYYDAECPEGKTNWRELPLFVNNAMKRFPVDGV